MMNDTELETLLANLESDRVEVTISTTDTDKFCEAVCSFANDLPNHRLSGVLVIGLKDNGSCGNVQITDQLLQNLGDLRSNGNIIPLPTITVAKRRIKDCDVAIVEVQPSYDPPVRYKGRVCIRVGPRRAIASSEEERRLTEKRRSGDVPFDLSPVRHASIEDLDMDFFRKTYLQDRDTHEVFPTMVGLIAAGKEPQEHLPGAYVQFVRLAGRNLIDPIKDQKEIGGPLPDQIRQLDEVFKAHIAVESDFKSGSVEQRRPDYPLVALQQIARNALLHRNYEGTNAPARIHWFEDRIEILSPGGPFGQVSIENFGKPGITDYRNAHIAEAMKVLGYVQRFGFGIATARQALEANGNPELHFDVNANNVLAILRSI